MKRQTHFKEPQVNKLTTSIALTVILAAAHSEPATAQPPVNSKVSADLMSMANAATREMVIDAAASGDPEALAADLRALGARK
jgi:hypothetical protein